MNSNNLTALLTALAIVPLYFKEPSQPAPEKWEYTRLSLEEGVGYVSVTGGGFLAQASQGLDGNWDLFRGSKFSPVVSESVQDMNQAVSWGIDRYLEASHGLMLDGWQPFFVVPRDPRMDTVHYRRQVQ